MKKILIVNQNWVGDVLFSTPAIRALRRSYKDATIVCLVPPRCAGVLAANPHLNEVMTADDRAGWLNPGELLSAVRRVARGRFDTAFFFHRSRTKSWIARWAGIPERIGYAGRGSGRSLTRVIPEPETPVHKIDYFLGLLGAVGIPADSRELDFYPASSAASDFERLLSGHGLKSGGYAVAHAGGNWALKRWPAENFARWIDFFSDAYALPVVLCGSDGEEPLARRILSLTRGRAISLCGQTSFDTLALLLKNARMVLSNDSGPIHLAASQRVPVLGVFGPTSPELTGPVGAGVTVLRRDVGCEVPCYFRSCDHRICMESLTAESVFEATRPIMESAHAR